MPLPMCCHLGNATIFGNSRGAYILKASSASWTPIPLCAISIPLRTCPAVYLNPCFKHHGIYSRKAFVSVMSVNDTSEPQSWRLLISYWFLSSQFHVFFCSSPPFPIAWREILFRYGILGFILCPKEICCYYHKRQSPTFLKRILVPVKITKLFTILF